MAEPFTYPPSVDPSNGFSSPPLPSSSFHSLRPPVPLPPPTLPFSFPSFALSLLPLPLPSTPALIDTSTGSSLSYPSFIAQFHSLAHSLQTTHHLSKGSVAFVISPPRLDIPILYFSFLSLGVVVSPANPLSSPFEISSLIDLVKPSIIFATSATSSKLPPNSNIKSIFFDSFEFRSMLSTKTSPLPDNVFIRQDVTAAIQFSSGTTGRTKAAALSHRSFIAMTAGFRALRTRVKDEVALLVAPMFHSFGFFIALKGLALGETMVLMSRVGLKDILSAAAERYRATLMTTTPPVVVAMARAEEVVEYDLGAMETVFIGGAPLPH